MFFDIQIADLIVRIEHDYEEVKKRCQDYIIETDQEPDLTVRAADWYKDSLRAALEKQGDLASLEDPEGYIEYHSVHRSIYPRLPEFEALWIHASAVAVDGNGFAFTAPSGYGKTTQTMLWMKEFAGRATIINGDNPLIRRKNGVFHIYGSPFGGKEGYNANIAVPLKGICFLERSDVTEAIRLPQPMAFGQLVRDSNFGILTKRNHQVTMSLLEELVQEVPVFSLHCTKNDDAARLAYESIMGQ